MFFIQIIFVLFSSVFIHADPMVINNFQQAKKVIFKQLFLATERRKTFYCGCNFNAQKKIDPNSCGLKYRLDKKRAFRVEVEHIVPAHAFGMNFKEWREGDDRCVFHGGKKKGKKFHGRKCASLMNETYRLMESDLYNLYPAEGEVNKDRNNFSMSELPSSTPLGVYGKCETKIDLKEKKVEPRNFIKGWVARVYQYMDLTYPGKGIISNKNEKLFAAWDKMYPVTSFECEWGKEVQSLQGKANPVLDKVCTKFLDKRKLMPKP